MARTLRVGLAGLVSGLAKIVGRIVRSVVGATDRERRPRGMRPVWGLGAMTGVVGSRRAPVKVAHLARQPASTCAYWSPERDAAFVDRVASWVPEGELAGARAVLAKGDASAAVWPDGRGTADFAALRLR